MSERQKSELAAAVAAVMGEVKDLPKDGMNAEQRYAFTSESAIANAVRPLLAKHQLSILPESVTVEHDAYQTKSGGTMNRVYAFVTYRMLHSSSETLTLSSVGLGADSGDKAVAKALTAAYKSLLIQTFCLGRSGTDADESTPEEAAHPVRQSAPAPQRQAPAAKEGGPVMRIGGAKTKGVPLANLDERELQRALDWCNSQENPGPVVQSAKREIEGELQRRAVMPPVTHTVVGAPDDDEIPF